MATTPSSVPQEADVEILFNYLGKRYEDAYLDSPNLQDFVRNAISTLAPHSQVLDVGCGTGKPVADMVARAGHSVHGIDIAEEMVGIARGQVHGSEACPATFEKADMRTYMPLSPGAIDAVFAVYSLFQISPSDTYSMVFRFGEWLRPGGVLVLGFTPSSVLVEGQGTYDPLWDCVREVEKPWMTRVTKETLLSEERWRKVLEQAGFRVEVERSFRFVPKDEQHKPEEVHSLIQARKMEVDSLCGPFPLPDKHVVLSDLDQRAWMALQHRIVIEEWQDPILGPTAEDQRILGLGGGLRAFLTASQVSGKEATQSLLAYPRNLPFAENEFDAVYSFMALDTVPNLQTALSELARVTDLSSPTASITIVQAAPDNEVTRLLNTLSLPLNSESESGQQYSSHQGYLLHLAKKVLSECGFGSISLHRVRAKYPFPGHDPVFEAAEAVAAPWFCGGKNLAEAKKALAPHLRNLFIEHPGVLKNDLAMLVARPTQN
ncbi:hypothetical protein ASPVEDRAFT_45116 [Aspergillus versicolor CBS 583.65]|uniref:phosphoethanolamine N-methyltransferase n=1 Tax=Aspergillus versicolor CBS 583.65 TaxID=1036611 RepID=A0A1L9PW01_ASPVE|nr:uncharacterized protein ASPVEDRAFT_45116 [Aspergillus versicolor CBS 583.65]OJJ05615.1 hypothetical protein ASPVEDRAFT_45116 [Aspergillus versicolor CBS 583.65]